MVVTDLTEQKRAERLERGKIQLERRDVDPHEVLEHAVQTSRHGGGAGRRLPRHLARLRSLTGAEG